MFDDVDDDTDGDDEEPPYVHEQWQDEEVFFATFDDEDVGDDTVDVDDHDVDYHDGDDEEPPCVHEQWRDVEVCRLPYLSCAPALLVRPGDDADNGDYDDGDDDIFNI